MTATLAHDDLQVRTDSPRRDSRAVTYCNIWDIVAPGEPCPACESSFEERLARARGN
jgi:hypothetical protein